MSIKQSDVMPVFSLYSVKKISINQGKRNGSKPSLYLVKTVLWIIDFCNGFKWLQNKALRLISLIHHRGDNDSIAKSLILSPF